ncbi:MAG: RCC1 domain-containing protein, partial [Chloroflexaceae bacterium]
TFSIFSLANTLRCWGAGVQTSVPDDLGPVSQVSTGGSHACAITTAGTLRCWGDNYYGQTSVPADLEPVSQVSAGFFHTCAITTAGTLRCWGGNPYGQATVPRDPLGVPPVVQSITRAGASPTSAASVTFTVTFSEAITGVDAADFALTTTGTLSGVSVSGVSSGPTVYTVTVNTGSGDGTLRLDVRASGTGIVDAAGDRLAGGFTDGEVYTIDRTPPGPTPPPTATATPPPTATATPPPTATLVPRGYLPLIVR